MMNSSERKSILITSSERGTANILVYIAKELKRINAPFKILVDKRAVLPFENAGLDYSSPEEYGLKNSGKEALIDYLKKEKTSLVITGIMGEKKDGLDFNFILAARELKIRVVTFLDSWLNYSDRLASIDGRRRFEYLTDKLVLMNRYAYGRMLSDAPDIDTSHLEIIGHLYYNDILKRIEKTTSTLPICDAAPRLLFLSQPIEEIYGNTPQSPNYIGYTQYEIVEKIINAVKKIKQNYEIIIRIHPRDIKKKYERYLSPEVNIKIDEETDPEELIKSSDIILGMSTIMLIDSILLKKYTASVQIGLREERDMCVLTESGFLKPLMTEEELFNFLENHYKDNIKDNLERRKPRLIEWLECQGDPLRDAIQLIENQLTGREH